MLRISKGPEPDCLRSTREDYVSRFGEVDRGAWSHLSGTCKNEMREAAFSEQGGLCAYCMSRLTGSHAADKGRPEKGGMTLEHWKAQSAVGSHALSWENLLGVCPGTVVGGQEAERQHCDTFRGALLPARQALTYNPAAYPPDVGGLFRYDTMGGIQSSDAAAREDTERLNLNHPRLKRNRREVLDAIRSSLQRNDSEAALRRLLADYSQPDAKGRLRPYAGVGVAYVAKKLRARGR